MNIIFVAPCDFLGNSAFHIFALAQQLVKRNHDCLVLTPGDPSTVWLHGSPTFRVGGQSATYDNPRPVFTDGRTADIVHAWTPREHVRRLTEVLVEANDCPYVVHMEDHEEQILVDAFKGVPAAELQNLPNEVLDAVIGSDMFHPRRGRALIAEASGFTCVTNSLLSFAPEGTPSAAFYPGYDVEFSAEISNRKSIRHTIGLTDDETAVLFAGNTHRSIFDDVSALYLAIGLLQRRGRKVRLVRTGRDAVDLGWTAQELNQLGVIDLGFVPRQRMPEIMQACDILVQPGQINTFNRHRFPSKLPEFLATGHPTILPDCNLGFDLVDGVNAIKLKVGDANDIANCIERIFELPDRGRSIGSAGREFATNHLTWEAAATIVEEIHRDAVAHDRKPPSFSIAPAGDLPIRTIAFYTGYPQANQPRDWNWNDVVGAERQFPTHRQPRIPGDLGFYDWRLPDTLHLQAQAAKAAGISAFCYRLTGSEEDAGVLNAIASGPDFPFCFLLSGVGAITPDAVNSALVELWRDKRHIAFNHAPLLVIDGAAAIPDPIPVVLALRCAARKRGIARLHVVWLQSSAQENCAGWGLDAIITAPFRIGDHRFLDRNAFTDPGSVFKGVLRDYIGTALSFQAHLAEGIPTYAAVMPGWDTTPVEDPPQIFLNDSINAYRYWLGREARRSFEIREQQPPVIFIHAWNDWAHGAYLEPEQGSSPQKLSATRLGLCDGVADYLKH